MEKGKKKAWRIVLLVLGGFFFLSSLVLFTSDTASAIFGLAVTAGLIIPPIISFSKDKKRARTSAPVVDEQKPSLAGAAVRKYDYKDYARMETLPDSYVCVDLETTGLYANRDRIIEAAAARILNGEIVDRFSSLVHSPVPISAAASAKTGITQSMISSAPEESEVARKLHAFIGDLPIVGYNVSFDLGFLHYAFIRAGLPFGNACFDVLAAARKCLPGLASYKLESVVAQLGVDQAGAHRALADVQTTAAVAEKLRPMLMQADAKEAAKVDKDLMTKIRRNAFSYHEDIDYKAIVPTGNIDPDAPFVGKSVSFSGPIKRMTRLEACQIVANLGGTPRGSVTKGTSFLVLGEGPLPEDIPGYKPGKVKTAEQWQAKGSAIRIISETEFFEMIDSYEAKK